MAKKTSGKGMGLKGRILLAVFVLTSLVFYQISVLLLVGMLPTIGARMMDKTPDRTKALTVGFMNFAGCFPFCYELLQRHGDKTAIFSIISNPLNIVIMYSAAVLGYVIEWGVVGAVAGLVVQKDKHRLTDIKKTQEALIKKWGPEVAGELPQAENGSE